MNPAYTQNESLGDEEFIWHKEKIKPENKKRFRSPLQMMVLEHQIKLQIDLNTCGYAI